jgi:hypothetical protein
LSWNLAGLKESQIDDFLAHTSMEHPWDVLLLQEAFRKTSGLEFDAEHLLLTAPRLEGNLRCPSIIVRSELAGMVKSVGGGTRWVAA